MIVFFGSSKYSVPTLKKLSENSRDIIVVTSGDKPAGRGNKTTPNPLKEFAQEKKLPILTPKKLDSLALKQLKEAIGKKLPSLGVCCVYGKIIPENWLKFFPKGILNIHPSLLPKYRGPSPAQFAILSGEKKMGVSIIKMDSEIDHGPILFQKEHFIDQRETSETLFGKLFLLAANNINSISNRYINGKINPREQNHSQATLTSQISKSDGFINKKAVKLALGGKSIPKSLLPKIISQPNPEVENFPPEIINRARRAFTPWPGIFTKVKITRKGKSEEKNLKIIETKTDGKSLEIKKVQLEGKTPVTFCQFCSAYQIF